MFDFLNDPVIDFIFLFLLSDIAFILLLLYLYLRKMNGGDKK